MGQGPGSQRDLDPAVRDGRPEGTFRDLQPVEQPDRGQRAFALRKHARHQNAVLRGSHELAVAALCAAGRHLRVLIQPMKLMAPPFIPGAPTIQQGGALVLRGSLSLTAAIAAVFFIGPPNAETGTAGAGAGNGYPLAAIAAVVDQTVARYQLPGIAVGIIVDGKVQQLELRGETVAGSGQPVEPDTLFEIASNTKAMTAALLARLVDAGKLRWDDPVIKHLPQFRMHDPWVTQHMTVADLLVHNSGLPEGGGDLMLWPEPNHFDRDDIINGLAHIKPAYGFRSGYAYDNLLYVVAGEVAAAVGGAPYEEMVRREVFRPLGLDRCRVGEIDRKTVGNIARPHRREDGRNVPASIDGDTIPAITSAAAGGIRCSLDDMLV